MPIQTSQQIAPPTLAQQREARASYSGASNRALTRQQEKDIQRYQAYSKLSPEQKAALTESQQQTYIQQQQAKALAEAEAQQQSALKDIDGIIANAQKNIENLTASLEREQDANARRGIVDNIRSQERDIAAYQNAKSQIIRGYDPQQVLKAADVRIQEGAIAYAELGKPKPTTVQQVQELIKQNEKFNMTAGQILDLARFQGILPGTNKITPQLKFYGTSGGTSIEKIQKKIEEPVVMQYNIATGQLLKTRVQPSGATRISKDAFQWRSVYVNPKTGKIIEDIGKWYSDQGVKLEPGKEIDFNKPSTTFEIASIHQPGPMDMKELNYENKKYESRIYITPPDWKNGIAQAVGEYITAGTNIIGNKIIPEFTVSYGKPSILNPTGLSIGPSFYQNIIPGNKKITTISGGTIANVGSYAIPYYGQTKFAIDIAGVLEKGTLGTIAAIKEGGVKLVAPTYISYIKEKPLQAAFEVASVGLGGYALFKYAGTPTIKTTETIIKKSGIPPKQQGFIEEAFKQTRISGYDSAGKAITTETKGLGAIDYAVKAGRTTTISTKFKDLFNLKPIYSGTYAGNIKEYQAALIKLQKYGLTAKQPQQTIRQVKPVFNEIVFKGNARIIYAEGKQPVIEIAGTKTITSQKFKAEEITSLNIPGQEPFILKRKLITKTMGGKPKVSVIVSEGKALEEVKGIQKYQFQTFELGKRGKTFKGELTSDIVFAQPKGNEIIFGRDVAKYYTTENSKQIKELFNIGYKVGGKTKRTYGDVKVFTGEPETKIFLEKSKPKIFELVKSKTNQIKDSSSKFIKEYKETAQVLETPKTQNIFIPPVLEQTQTTQGLIGKLGSIIKTKPRSLPKVFQPINKSKNILMVALSTISKVTGASNSSTSTTQELRTTPSLSNQMKFDTTPKSDTTLRTTPALRVTPSLATELRTIPETPVNFGINTRPRQTPTTPPPIKPVPEVPPTFFWFKTKEKKAEDNKPYYPEVYIDATKKEKAHWQRISDTPMTKRSALSYAAEVVDNTISSRGKVVQVKKKVNRIIDSGNRYYENNQQKFRTFQQKRGVRTSIPNQIIERAKYRLDKGGETKTIQTARRTPFGF
jgi:hypothetical protein